MGGEPTFVSLDDPDGAEWNTAALGPNKRALAAQLYHRLRDHYAPHGLVHYGQGKWYPGEQLPRWSLNCIWRRDGQPIWQRSELIADERRDYGVTAESAQRFLRALAERLGLDPRHVFAGFEDVFYYLWRERRLPINVDPLDSRVDDPQERARLMRVFSQGLDRVAGHVLPIARNAAGTRWQSGSWFLREQRCYLIPGDSPMGYRLPLDSQPWVTRGEYPYVHAPDPTQGFPPLPPSVPVRAQPRAGESTVPLANHAPRAHESASWITRTALCAEPRDGVLYVFMPPTERAEDYLELVAAIEATAAALEQPVLLEGYEPPRDPRLNHFRITPDPGRDRSQYPSGARLERAGRAHHVPVPGGARAAARHGKVHARRPAHRHRRRQSLRARRRHARWTRRSCAVPTCSRACWRTGTTIHRCRTCFRACSSARPRRPRGWTRPATTRCTSSSSRSSSCRAPGSEVPPWLTDRLLRNLLIDVTGNTHRAEFCIDKLYSPDGPAGRLGLLELRAFEMPPHPRMSLTQQLLLRSLVARFWRAPYQPARLARWGTELHDRFMLPHFVQQDFRDVLAEQQAAGYGLELAWFAPHFEFRFPKYGDFAAMGDGAGAAPGARTLACDGRGGRGRRRGALCRFVGGARAGQGHGPGAGPLRDRLQWPPRAAAADRHGRRIRRRGALSCVAAILGATPAAWSQFAIDL